jgi:GNAT superfamily N-acetyltransferase
MLWQVRALLDDRPGALAALAVGCGDQSVNILGLQIFPAADGRVVDELVLHTPGGWTALDVAQLCALSGLDDPEVVECSPHALEDQPVRYVRAAQVVMEEPDLLEDQLCRLLDAFPADGLPGLEALVLDDEYGPSVSLTRRVAFTDTEIARASELRRFAAVALGADPGPALGADPGPAVARRAPGEVENGEAMLRLGTVEDAPALIAMHARCSAESVYRRYHSPVARLSPRQARGQLEPDGGLSLVMAVGDEVVGIGMLAVDATGVELGVMVEDRWQRRGYGTKLLRALAVEAANRGVDTVTCMVQPANQAVLRTIHRARLRALVSYVDGVTEYRIPVGRLAGVTAPLVALLHERRELREVYPAADLVDQAVRGGA